MRSNDTWRAAGMLGSAFPIGVGADALGGLSAVNCQPDVLTGMVSDMNAAARVVPEVNSPFAVEPVMRPRQQVEAQLRRAILSGVFVKGDRLPSEVQLAEQFQVSRSTIREALRALVEAGLLRKIPGARGGSFVEYFDHNGLANVVVERIANTLELGGITYDEVAEFRNVLEVPSAGLAALHRTEAQITSLREVIEREKSTSVTDPEVDAYNVRFHKTVADASGNRLLAAFVSALHDVAHPLRFIDTSPQVGRDAVKHHIEIVSALAAGDADRAEMSMRNHLEFLRVHAAPVPPGLATRTR